MQEKFFMGGRYRGVLFKLQNKNHICYKSSKGLMMNKNKLFAIFAGIFILGLSFAMAQAEPSFDNIDKIVGDFGESGKKTIGVFGSYLIGLGSLAITVIGIVMGVKQAQKKAEQHGEGSSNTLIAALVGGVAGTVVSFVIILLFGAVFLGNSGTGLDILYKFWQGVFGVGG
jgi:hypothetical protein